MNLKKWEKLTFAAVKWLFVLSLPLWIYGLILALQKAEIKPLAAMLILNGLSGYFFYQQIIMTLVKRKRILEIPKEQETINGK